MNHHRAKATRCRAFTLIEILVVIGILVGLMGILVPTINKARIAAKRSRMASDLQAISTALEAYKNDFGDYPRVEYTNGVVHAANRPEPPTGAQILCWALIGPGPLEDKSPQSNQHLVQDGADGPGFRTRVARDSSGNAVGSGKVFGPYLPADKFHIGNPASPDDKDPTKALLWTLLDADNKPILYAPASPKHLNPRDTTAPTPSYIFSTNATALPNSALQTFVWDLTDLIGDVTTGPILLDDTQKQLFTRVGDTQTKAAAYRISAMLGDLVTTDAAGNVGAQQPDGRIGGPETPATTGPYLLWMAGPDGKFGPDAEINITAKDVKNCDDVTNFNQ